MGVVYVYLDNLLELEKDGTYNVYAQIIDTCTPDGMLSINLNDYVNINDYSLLNRRRSFLVNRSLLYFLLFQEWKYFL